MRNVKGLMCIVAVAGLGASVAQAQTNPSCRRNVGPDIIVGDIQGTANYSAAGGLDAYAIASYSCNVGNVWVNWFETTTEHPVVGFNIFKYRQQPAGYYTFEQIGQSWLKHTFFALSNNLCCTGCQGTNGQHLGIACSDPYTAGRNGSQSDAGPKWQVNAHTGLFPYPPANPSFAGSTARRIQVNLSDLEASNGGTIRYYVDCQYVAADDSAAGNQNNNTSYRPVTMTVTGTPPNVTNSSIVETGTTVQEQVGLAAWKSIDPTVTLSPVDIPAVPSGTERVYVASKATSLGGGMWHYEYAVYNQNSDQSIGTFSVPCPPGTTVTNIGFHDVAYRNGDGIGNADVEGTDWVGSFANGKVTWTTDETFAENGNGNAVRWGTQYNFRFDANIAPVTACAVSLSTFKTGAPFPANPVSVNATGQMPPLVCYANCDLSTASPCLNVQDFSCYLNKFANNDCFANCDNSTTAPILNIQDFSCYLNKFAAGCSSC